jgi:hypothetical protein
MMGAKFVTFPVEFSEGQRAIIREIVGEARKANKEEDANVIAAAIQAHKDACEAPKVIEQLKGARAVWRFAAVILGGLATGAGVYAAFLYKTCK